MEKDTRFLNQGQYNARKNRRREEHGAKDASAKRNGNDNSETVSSHTDYIVFLNQKTKKLTTALYVVTDFLSDAEPMKWKMREAGVGLLREMSDRNNSVSFLKAHRTEECLLFKVAEIISLLEIAMGARLISEMNFSILKNEYVLLAHALKKKNANAKFKCAAVVPEKFLKEKKVSHADSIFFDAYESQKNQIAPRDILEDDISSLPRVSVSDFPRYDPDADADFFSGGGLHIRERAARVSDAAARRGSGYGSAAAIDYESRKGVPLGGLRAQSVKDIVRESTERKKDIKADRRGAIIKLLKEKGDAGASIKDIAAAVPGCSEKTIQRELLFLAGEGVLVKSGERRWSRYFLKRELVR